MITNERIAAIKRVLDCIDRDLLAEIERLRHHLKTRTLAYEAMKESRDRYLAMLDEELAQPALPRCSLCGGIMHSDNTDFIFDADVSNGGIFRHKCSK